MTKSFLTEYRLELSCFLSLLFGFLTFVGAIGAYLNTGHSLPSYLQFLQDLVDPFGYWTSYFVIIGPVGLIISLWWFYDYVKKTRKLMRLIDTPSKAKFVRNIDDIDYLAWSLPQRWEDKVIAKKKELRI